MNKKIKGFTLIEILVVIALIAILAAITIIAINPAKNFADARNTQRSADALTILNAVTQYTSEQGHALGDFGTIKLCTAGVTLIGDTPLLTAPNLLVGDMVDLGTLLVGANETYLVAIPIDPGSGFSASNTGYTICRTAGNRVQIDAPNAENGKVISIKR